MTAISGKSTPLALMVVGLLAFAPAATAGNFMAFNRAFGSSTPIPINGPATWTGTAGFAGSSPASFNVGAFDANFLTSFVNPTPPTIAGVIASTQVVSVTGPLSSGTFAPGGGPGAFLFHPPPDPSFGTRIGTAQVIAGSQQFGGSVAHAFKFLSKLTLNFGFANFAGTFPLSEVQGVSTPSGATKPTQSFTGTFANTTNSASATQVFLRANFFPWTTGIAIGKDSGGNANTTVTLTGYDNRTPAGMSGTVQMVAPFLYSSFNAGAFGVNHLSGVNVLRYEFMPEPGHTVQLVAGLVALLVMSGVARLHRRA